MQRDMCRQKAQSESGARVSAWVWCDRCCAPHAFESDRGGNRARSSDYEPVAASQRYICFTHLLAAHASLAHIYTLAYFMHTPAHTLATLVKTRRYDHWPMPLSSLPGRARTNTHTSTYAHLTNHHLKGVNSHFLMRETQKGYSFCTIKWCFVIYKYLCLYIFVNSHQLKSVDVFWIGKFARCCPRRNYSQPRRYVQNENKTPS